tara:strand:+ start:326 stop:496 length:171 start_codon:yes stop_codon:yes gene_type:complete
MIKIVFYFFFFLSPVYSLDYLLLDVNESSETFGQYIGPSYFLNQNKLTIAYFGWEA